MSCAANGTFRGELDAKTCGSLCRPASDPGRSARWPRHSCWLRRKWPGNDSGARSARPDWQGAKALAPWRAAARYVKQAYDPADVFQASHPVTRGQALISDDESRTCERRPLMDTSVFQGDNAPANPRPAMDLCRRQCRGAEPGFPAGKAGAGDGTAGLRVASEAGDRGGPVALTAEPGGGRARGTARRICAP